MVSADLFSQGTCTAGLWWPATLSTTLPPTRVRATTASLRMTVCFAIWPWCIPIITL